EVLTEGRLGSRRHINLPGVKVSLPALTEKDLADVKLAQELRLDYLALSFVRQAKDILELKAALDGAGHRPQVIAKIEDQQAVKNLNEIITAADGVIDRKSTSPLSRAKHILELTAALDAAGHRPQIIAKSENQQAVKNLIEIISAADGV